MTLCNAVTKVMVHSGGGWRFRLPVPRSSRRSRALVGFPSKLQAVLACHQFNLLDAERDGGRLAPTRQAQAQAPDSAWIDTVQQVAASTTVVSPLSPV